MSISVQLKTLFNGTSTALKEVLPEQVTIHSPSIFTSSHAVLEYSVLIGMVGDLKARLIIDGNAASFSKICQLLYGMELQGDLLESFVGEFGNMIAGKVCTYSSTQNVALDISPPTVMIGQTQIPILQKTFNLPISIHSVGDLNLLLSIEK